MTASFDVQTRPYGAFTEILIALKEAAEWCNENTDGHQCDIAISDFSVTRAVRDDPFVDALRQIKFCPTFSFTNLPDAVKFKIMFSHLFN